MLDAFNKMLGDTYHVQHGGKDRNRRMERAYGSFQRMLSLPEDADRESVKAAFKKGVLTVTMPRKALEQTNVKRIEVKSTD